MKALFKSSMRKETQVEYLLSITVYSWFIEMRRIILFPEQPMNFISGILSTKEHKNQSNLKGKSSWKQKKEWWLFENI